MVKKTKKEVVKTAKKFRLKLRGSTAVFIDWANVYYWKNSLKCEIDLEKLYSYLRPYPKIKEIYFYFGTDKHPASKQQIKQAKRIGYKVITKAVKYLPKKTDTGEILWDRKCDFDLEIGLDCYENLKRFSGFIFFSGDGDFATLYKRLIKLKKQIVVVYMYGHLGREVWQLKRGIFKVSIKKLGEDLYLKNDPLPKARGIIA